jgi:hypothetical protein
LLGVRNHENVFDRDQAAKTIHGLHEHGLVSHDGQEMLGTTQTALGPKTFSAAAGHNYHISVVHILRSNE